MDPPAYHTLVDTIDSAIGNNENNNNNAHATDGSGSRAAGPPLEIHIQPTVVDGKHVAVVSVAANPGGNVVERAAVNVVCVIDVSGSMNMSATPRNKENDESELSILDIVKHAVKTVVASLQPQDRCAIISFSTTARVEMGLTAMTDENRVRAETAVQSLQVRGSTNLWAGIDTALKLVERLYDDSKRPITGATSILVFTDGEPTDRPPQGELEMLKKRKTARLNKTNKWPWTMHMFGFGYTIDTSLLNNLAVHAGGAFAFIPDGAYVGTVLVYAVGNLLTTAFTNVSIVVRCNALTPQQRLLCGHLATRTDQGEWTLELGTCSNERSHAFVLELTDPMQNEDDTIHIDVSVSCTDVTTGTRVTMTRTYGHTFGWVGASVATTNTKEYWRAVTVESILRAHELAKGFHYAQACDVIGQLLARLPTNEPSLDPLRQDVQGEVTMALEARNFTRWGRHYLLSLATAHRLQQCNNFKDPGVQVYKTPQFEHLVDKIEEIFLKLTAPVSRRTSSGTNFGNSGNASARPLSPVNMRTYYDPEGVCIAGHCDVLMANGTHQKVASLRRGDKVLVSNNRHLGVVEAILCSPMQDDQELVAFASGLVITPWHPVKLNYSWCFPADAAATSDGSIGARRMRAENCKDKHMVSILFAKDPETNERGISLYVNGIECAALAHGVRDDPVLTHDFFGTERVVQAMKSCMDGKMMIAGVYRSKKDGRVQNLAYPIGTKEMMWRGEMQPIVIECSKEVAEEEKEETAEEPDPTECIYCGETFSANSETSGDMVTIYEYLRGSVCIHRSELIFVLHGKTDE